MQGYLRKDDWEAVKDILRKFFGGDGKDGSKISTLHLWANVVQGLLSKNMSEKGPVRDKNFYASSNAIYSGRDNVTYLYTIDGYPSSIPVNLKKELRSRSRGDVRISYISTFEPTSIPWDTAQMQSKLRTWSQADDKAEDLTEFNYYEKSGAMFERRRRSESLVYLAQAELNRGKQLFTYRTMMLISGTRGELFDEVVEDTEKSARAYNINITRVDNSLEEYLKAFSPFSMVLTDKVKKEVGNPTLSDEIIARLTTYDQGQVGYGDTYMGTDIDSDFPVFKQFKTDSDDAENMVVTAETGGGKSFYVKGLLIQLLGSPLYVATVMDIEGDEYTPIANFLRADSEETSEDRSVVILNMAEGSGSYFDPCEIIRVEDEEYDRDMASLSVSCVSSILTVLMGTDLGNRKSWVDNIIEKVVSEAYERRGVIMYDSNTWNNSRGMSLKEVYNVFLDVYRETKNGQGVFKDYVSDTTFSEALNIAHSRLGTYFSPSGSRASVFRERVTLSELANAKLVICSFGMRGRAPNTVNPVQMALMQIYAAHISHLRSIFSKLSGRYNFKVWEEFQRWGQFPGSESTINTALTGGRKLGDINLIATNKLSELLEADKFGVIENTTSFAIGAIRDRNVYEEICERLSMPNMVDELSKIVVPKENKGEKYTDEGEVGDPEDQGEVTEDSKYRMSFLVILDKSDISMVKMDFPSSISESKLLRTGVDLTKNVELQKSGSEEYNNLW